MTLIGRLVEVADKNYELWEWEVFDVLFNDNPGFGKHYINLNIAKDGEGNLLGHSFSYTVFDGTGVEEVAVSNDPLELVDQLPWRFHDRARTEVDEFMSTKYQRLLTGHAEPS